GLLQSPLDSGDVAGLLGDYLSVADVAFADGDRRTQLVADDADEFVALFLERFLTSDVAQQQDEAVLALLAVTQMDRRNADVQIDGAAVAVAQPQVTIGGRRFGAFDEL